MTKLGLAAKKKRAKARNNSEFMTVFVYGKQKRVRRPPMIDGMTVEEFISRNAAPIFLHQEEMWELLEPAATVVVTEEAVLDVGF